MCFIATHTYIYTINFLQKENKMITIHLLQSQGRLESVNCQKSAAADDVIPKKSDFHAADNVTI